MKQGTGPNSKLKFDLCAGLGRLAANRRTRWNWHFALLVALTAAPLPALCQQQVEPQAAVAPAPAVQYAQPGTQGGVYYSQGRNPLPLGSNTGNQPLQPGTERYDYGMQSYVEGQPLVLLAISGGGSRSAYYAARVMEELAKIPMPGVQNQPLPDGRPMYSLLDTVRGISTVSAGGLASTWYVTNFDRRKQPGFFDEMKAAVSVNLQWRTYGHMALFPPLAIQLLASSVTRTDLLADEIDTLLGNRDLTFNDLRTIESRPIDPAPALMINGTVYNTGQRLVMTNLPGSRFPSRMGEIQANIAMPETDQQINYNLLQPLTFADIGSDIGSFPVSKALAASAAYPILLAPVPVRVYPQYVPPHLVGRVDKNLLESQIAYVADGGLYENDGADVLLSLLKTVDDKQPVLMMIIDGSARMETLKLNEGEIFGISQSLGRMYDIGNLKAIAQYPSMLSEVHDPKKLEVVFIRMEGQDEKTQNTLRNIPTQFKLSDDHREALDNVAVQNVAQMYDPLMRAYGRLSGAISKRRQTVVSGGE